MIKLMNHPLSISIAHINDTHSYFEPVSLPLSLNIDGQEANLYVSSGGFARIKTQAELLRKKAKEEQRHFLFLHAGDCFQGTLFFSLFKGKANAHMLNELNIDAMTVGNHELDIGNDVFAQFAKQVSFPILAGNWDLTSEDDNKKMRLSENERVLSYDPDLNVAQCLIKKYDNEKLAIFGLCLDRMDEISSPDPDTPFLNSIEIARKTVQYLHKISINKIIVLSHLGYDADKELARNVDGISLIIGGHSHILQGDYSAIGLEKQDKYGLRINNTYIVQSGCYGQAIGHCELDFDEHGFVTRFNGSNRLLLGRRLFIDAKREAESQSELYNRICTEIDRFPLIAVCEKDRHIQEILQDNYLSKVDSFQKNRVACIPNTLRHVRIPDEKGASDIAPLVAKAFYFSMKKRGYPVQFGLHNAGGVRCSLPSGDISAADIAGKLLPFAIPIGVYFISGQSLHQTVEGALDNAFSNGVEGTGTGSYPYCYGLRYQYVERNRVGERLTSLQLYIDHSWIDVNPLQSYCGTSSSYTMKGKEGYNAITQILAPSYISNITMADAFIESLNEQRDFLPSSLFKHSQVHYS